MRLGRPLAVLLLWVGLTGCDRHPPTATTRPGRPTVASTVPAATDLVVGMGLADRLVAVSTFDPGPLPKAGDYQTTDWELLATLRPTVLLTAIDDDRQPAGFRRHADALGIRLLNVPVKRLDDLGPAMDALGAALADPAAAAAARATIKRQLDDVEHHVAGLPPVPTLISISGDASAVVGPDSYLDDVLQKAGGTNVAAPLGKPWPTVDREMLRSLHPSVVIQMVPGGRPQEVAQARATWAAEPSVRLCVITSSYALQPGWHLPAVAAEIAECLHPSSTPRP